MYFEDFAAADNEAMLEIMYQDCDDREGEMNYTKLEIVLAVQVEIIASNKVIQRNYENLGKKNRPWIPESITLTREALNENDRQGNEEVCSQRSSEDLIPRCLAGH